MTTKNLLDLSSKPKPDIKIIERIIWQRQSWKVEFVKVLVAIFVVSTIVWGVSVAEENISDEKSDVIRPKNWSVGGLVEGFDGVTLIIDQDTPGSSDTDSYAVDVSSISIIETAEYESMSLADIKIGDRVIIQGSVRDSKYFAKRIISFGAGLVLDIVATSTDAIATTTDAFATSTDVVATSTETVATSTDDISNTTDEAGSGGGASQDATSTIDVSTTTIDVATTTATSTGAIETIVDTVNDIIDVVKDAVTNTVETIVDVINGTSTDETVPSEENPSAENNDTPENGGTSEESVDGAEDDSSGDSNSADESGQIEVIETPAQ